MEGFSEIEAVTTSSMYEINLYNHEGRGGGGEVERRGGVGEGGRGRGGKGTREEEMQRWR